MFLIDVNQGEGRGFYLDMKLADVEGVGFQKGLKNNDITYEKTWMWEGNFSLW